jgi:hypothetical protein
MARARKTMRTEIRSVLIVPEVTDFLTVLCSVLSSGSPLSPDRGRCGSARIPFPAEGTGVKYGATV